MWRRKKPGKSKCPQTKILNDHFSQRPHERCYPGRDTLPFRSNFTRDVTLGVTHSPYRTISYVRVLPWVTIYPLSTEQSEQLTIFHGAKERQVDKTKRKVEVENLTTRRSDASERVKWIREHIHPLRTTQKTWITPL